MTVRTRAQLNADADTFLPDNSLGEIGAEDVRQRVKDLADSAALLAEENQPLTGGADVVVNDIGNLSGNTITIRPGGGPAQKITNNGAGSVNFHATAFGSGRLIVVNTSGAGVITIAAGIDVTGSFDTTNGSVFLCGYENYSEIKTLSIQKKA